MKYGSYEDFAVGFRNRLFQLFARIFPGSSGLRVWLHRRRGVRIGRNVFIGTDVIIDTSTPYKVSIGDNVTISMRSTLIGHFGNYGIDHIKNSKYCLMIEDNCFIGPGVIIMPNVTISQGAVVAAGSIVTVSVAAGTMVQGNPAKPVAICGIPLTRSTPMWQFVKNLKPVR